MASAGYNAYIKSARWRRKCNRKIKTVGGRCQYTDKQGKRCWEQSRLHVHHLTYIHFMHEKLSELEVLCGDHHAVRELMKYYCLTCNRPVFASDAKAIAFWREYKRKYPKDWLDAIVAAKAAATTCEKCHDKGGTTAGPVQGPAQN